MNYDINVEIYGKTNIYSEEDCIRQSNCHEVFQKQNDSTFIDTDKKSTHLKFDKISDLLTLNINDENKTKIITTNICEEETRLFVGDEYVCLDCTGGFLEMNKVQGISICVTPLFMINDLLAIQYQTRGIPLTAMFTKKHSSDKTIIDKTCDRYPSCKYKNNLNSKMKKSTRVTTQVKIECAVGVKNKNNRSNTISREWFVADGRQSVIIMQLDRGYDMLDSLCEKSGDNSFYSAKMISKSNVHRPEQLIHRYRHQNEDIQVIINNILRSGGSVDQVN